MFSGGSRQHHVGPQKPEAVSVGGVRGLWETLARFLQEHKGQWVGKLQASGSSQQQAQSQAKKSAASQHSHLEGPKVLSELVMLNISKEPRMKWEIKEIEELKDRIPLLGPERGIWLLHCSPGS